MGVPGSYCPYEPACGHSTRISWGSCAIVTCATATSTRGRNIGDYVTKLSHDSRENAYHGRWTPAGRRRVIVRPCLTLSRGDVPARGKEYRWEVHAGQPERRRVWPGLRRRHGSLQICALP